MTNNFCVNTIYFIFLLSINFPKFQTTGHKHANCIVSKVSSFLPRP